MKIGVFDSGVGGLTVLKKLATAFPAEEYLYLGDTARLPYGTKSPETIRQYSVQIMNHLKDQNVDAIVIACNTASSQVPESHWHGIPVLNVIDPGAQWAVAQTKNKKIGVLGTRATIGSDIYAKKIKQLLPEATVLSQSCPLLVPLAEEGWTDDPVTELIIARYVAPLLDKGIDTLVLGCTHYPLLEKPIQKAFQGNITLVDSGEAICEILKSGLLKNGKSKPSLEPKICFSLTDSSAHTFRLAEKILSPLKITQQETVHLIPTQTTERNFQK